MYACDCFVLTSYLIRSIYNYVLDIEPLEMRDYHLFNVKLPLIRHTNFKLDSYATTARNIYGLKFEHIKSP